jgi:hypothetical protein
MVQALAAGTPTPTPGSRIFEPGIEIKFSAYIVRAGSSIRAASVVPCRGTSKPGFRSLESQVTVTAESTQTHQEIFPSKKIFGKTSTGAWADQFTVPRSARPGLYDVAAACVALSFDATHGIIETDKITTHQPFYIQGPAMAASFPPGISIRPGSSFVIHVRNNFGGALLAWIDSGKEGRQINKFSAPANDLANVAVTIPANTSPGRHVISIDSVFPQLIPGNAAAVSLPVTVTAAAVTGGGAAGRSSKDTTSVPASLPTPHQIASNHLGRTLIEGLLLAILATLLVGFPADLFNKTVEENRAEIRAWFPSWLSRRPRLPGRLDLVLFLIIGGILLTSVDRSVQAGGTGFARNAAYTFVAAVVAILFTTLLYEAPAEGILRRASRIPARLGTVPFAGVVAILLGLLSYAGHFVPGYIYGLFIVYLADTDRRTDSQSAGAAVLSGAACMLGVSVVLWPVEALHAGSGSLVQTVLSWIVVVGIQSSLFLLFPLRFMDGYQLFRWRRLVWAILFLIASFFFFVLMVIQTNDPYLEAHGRDAVVTSLTLFVAFGLGSFAFWSYFRFRPEVDGEGKAEANRNSPELTAHGHYGYGGYPAEAPGHRQRSTAFEREHEKPDRPHSHRAKHAKP